MRLPKHSNRKLVGASWDASRGGCAGAHSTRAVLMSQQDPGAQIAARRQRPLWVVPLVTALVFVAVILVLYPSTPG